MINLLENVDGFTIRINPEFLSIKAVSDLVNSRGDKNLLYKEISFIYFYCNLLSDFNSQKDLKLRKEEIKKYLGLKDTWDIDKYLERVIELYTKSQEEEDSYALLKTLYNMVEKIKVQLDNIDLNERDKNDKPIWNIKIINDTVKGMPELMESLKKAEAQFIKAQKTGLQSKSGSLYDGLILDKR